MEHSWIVIELTQGYAAIISYRDYERVRKHSWHIHKSAGTKKKPGQPYARSNIGGKKVYLHRFIMLVEPKDHVDHRNFQTLDNRRQNLKKVSPKENIMRRRNCEAVINPPPEPMSLFEEDHA